MSTVKHYNGTDWELDAAGNARNIALENESLLDKDTTSISVERGFQKINTKISKLEHYLAWIYQNGAKGGSGSGSGSGTSYTITILNNQSTFYTTGSTLTFKAMIESGSVKKKFTIYAQDVSTGSYLINGTQTVYSQSYNTITIEGLTSDCTISLWAVDSTGDYLTGEILLTVKVGAINISENTSSVASIYYIGETVNIYDSYSILNKTGNIAYLAVYNTTNSDPLTNNITPIDIIEIPSSSTNGTYQIDYGKYIDLNVLNKTYNFKVCVYSTVLSDNSGNYLHSLYFSHSIKTASGSNLTIITSGIATEEDEASNFTFSQGNTSFINIVCSYNGDSSSANTFYLKYEVFLIKDNVETSLLQSDGGTYTVNTVGDVQFQLGAWDIDAIYKIVIEASNNSDYTGLYDKAIGYFTVVESSSGDLRNYKGNLIYHYGAFNKPDTSKSTSTYTIQTEGDYGISSGQFPLSLSTPITRVNLNLINKTNSTGFKVNSTNKVNYINLTGNTYAIIPEFKTLLLPATTYTDISSNKTIYNYSNNLFGSGFYLLFTYKFTLDNPVDLTVLSLGTYNNGELENGFEVSSEHIMIKSGSLYEEIDAPIKGENLYEDSTRGTTDLITIGLNCWQSDVETASGSVSTYYFALYIDGIMTKCLEIPQTDFLNTWGFKDNLYFGCRSDLTQQANCYIYDIKLYSSKQSPLSLVYNFMSAIELSNLTSEQEVDTNLDSNLRLKNFFSTELNTCLLCDDSTGEYKSATEILANLKNSYQTYGLNYPVIYLEETSTESEMYRIVRTTNWTRNSPEIKYTFPVKVSIYTKYTSNPVEIDADNDDLRPHISIQGTSTLAYNIKNFELKLGEEEDGTEKLLKINGWLPENEFTLKADVVDSSHANNVVIGNWINNSGFFSNAYSIGSDMQSSNLNIVKKRKYTSEGFPCLVFIKYADQGSGATTDSNGITTGRTDFYGIYNFNLGRYAYNNLNLRVLESYTEPDPTLDDNAPQIITDYTIKDVSKNIFSLEVNDNFGDDYKLFLQADTSISESILDNRSYNDVNDDAYQCVTDTLFTRMAGMFSGDNIPKYKIETLSDGNTQAVKITNSKGEVEYWTPLDNNTKVKSSFGNVISVNSLYKYLVTALVFGMVDSTCKNMVLRSWDAVQSSSDTGTTWSAIWNLCFYDMDSSMKLNNAGSENVPYDVHTNKFNNFTSGGLTSSGDSRTTGVTWNAELDTSEALTSYGGVHNNRFWDIIRDYDSVGNSDVTNGTMGDYYWELRELIPDPETFIDENFATYINKTGAILYNYDYELKYVSYGQVWSNGKLVSDTQNKQSSFLYGTRLNSIRNWFKKRINFLDSVYIDRFDTYFSLNTKPDNLTGYLVSTATKNSWAGRQTTSSTTVYLLLTAAQRYKVQYQLSSDSVTHTLWVSEDPTTVALASQANSNNTLTLYGFNGIIEIPQFYNLGIVGLTQTYSFELLKGLYNNGLTIESLGKYNSLSECPNLEVVSFKNVKCYSGETASIDLSNNSAVKTIDISNSDISSLVLSDYGTIEEIDMTSAKNILNLPDSINGLSGLKTLKLSGTGITSLSLSDLPSLETLELPENLKSLEISNCNMSNLILTWSNSNKLSSLLTLNIHDCSNLTSIDISGQNNLSNLIFTRCPNVESISLALIKTPNNCCISFDGKYTSGVHLDGLTKLKKLDISNTDLITTADLSESVDLSDLKCTNCTSLTSVICNYNEDNPIELLYAAFLQCSGLTTLKGYFDLQGSLIFDSCLQLPFDDLYNNNQLDFKITSNSIYRMFYNCTGLNGTWYKTIIHNLPVNCTNAEDAFNNSGISGELGQNTLCCIVDGIPTNMGLTNCKGMFEYTSISGAITSNVWKYLPNVTNIEAMFANTNILTIENTFFKGMSLLTAMDYVFSNCHALNNVIDENGNSAYLHSKDFFIDLVPMNHSARTSAQDSTVKNPSYIYPYGIFEGCNIKMVVDLDKDGYPYLFHTKFDYRTATSGDNTMLLDNLLYAGIDLIYEPLDEISTSTLFMPGERTDEDGTIYYVPYISLITSPFDSTSIILQLDNLSGEYLLNENLKILSSPFNGITLKGTLSNKLLTSENNKLTAIHNLFEGADMELGSTIYQFTTDFFKDCTLLENISGIFSNFKLYMRLCSNMFENCSNLTNVSNAFANSYLLGTIPSELLKGTSIKTMSGIFSGCYNLGYDEPILYFLGTEDEPHLYSEHFVLITAKDYETTKLPNPYNLAGTARVSKISDYSVPTDIFYYCLTDPVIEGVLGDLFYNKKYIVYDSTNGSYTTVISDEFFGPTDQSITNAFFASGDILNSTQLIGVFKNTHFTPYSSFNGDFGSMYPDSDDDLLFKYTPYLETLESMFSGTEIYEGCYIKSNIFKVDADTYLPLKSVSKTWSNCLFHTGVGSLSGDKYTNINQLESYTMFDALYGTLRDASYVFAGNSITGTGIYYISQDLLSFSNAVSTYDNPLNIDYMFSNCPLVSGQSAPLFMKDSSQYYTGNPGTYLAGITYGTLSNSELIMLNGYYPSSWDNEINLN